MTIVVNPNVTPTFTQVAPICSGGTLAALPTTSNNGITGSWSPALNNLATTTYTFTPGSGCFTTATMTIVVNPNVTPTFTQVAPICSGGTLAALPTTSNNGISGSWSPALNNLATTTYTFTPGSGCFNTATMTIVVNPNVTPTFTQVEPICSGGTLAALPTTSNNGISGSWSPAPNNLATTTYTFTPSSGCFAAASMTIEILNVATPTGEALQTFPQGATLASIVVNPSIVVWYSSEADAISGNNPLGLNQVLVNGSTYYAVSIIGLCRSQPFAVNVTITLGVDLIDMNNLKFYPNPVISELQISYNNPITNVEVYSMLGQLVLSKNFNATQVNLSLERLPSSVYLVKVISEEQVGEFKIIKQ
jgi:hypothetical protein